MLRNSRGRRDALLTFAAAGVVVGLGKVLLGGAVLAFGDKAVTIGPADATTVAAMTALLTAYVAKRVSGSEKHDPPTASSPEQEGR